MGFADKLRVFIVKEPVVFASCFIGGIGLILPAFVRPILDSMDSSEAVPQPSLNKVVAGMTGKKLE
uniref:Fiber protein Fb11 n=1 Tax=Picea sitchensis TaxID=3332 RepID=A9NL58_PICSI|nr:unknown [Picea sitchensis]